MIIMTDKIEIRTKKSWHWQYCVVGNIVKTRIDENGVLRFGTSAFSGGTKVYLCGKYWNPSYDKIDVIGICRGKRFYVDEIPVSLIENVRCSRAFNPSVLEIMNNWEFWNLWWDNTEDDRKATEEFVKKWNTEA